MQRNIHYIFTRKLGWHYSNVNSKVITKKLFWKIIWLSYTNKILFKTSLTKISMKTYFKKIRHENYTQNLCIELYYFLKMENDGK